MIASNTDSGSYVENIETQNTELYIPGEYGPITELIGTYTHDDPSQSKLIRQPNSFYSVNLSIL